MANQNILESPDAANRGCVQRVVRLTGKLLEARDTARQLLGEKRWREYVEEWRPQIEHSMQTFGTDSPLEAVLPAAKLMSSEGKNPLMMLAVATEMVQPSEPNARTEARWTERVR